MTLGVAGLAVSAGVAAFGFFAPQPLVRMAGYATEVFNPKSAKHVNIIIEDTLRDIEGGLRFRIIGYLQNYYDLSRSAFGENNAGVNVANLVEYGTTDSRVIELQEIGFSRGVATSLVRRHLERLQFADSGELIAIDVDQLLRRLEGGSEAHTEVSSILVKSLTAPIQ